MMDAKLLYPKGFHPQRTSLTPDAQRIVYPRHRFQASFPKYYFIDFGISAWFKEGHVGPRLVLGLDGQDKSVPELSLEEGYDPFKVDIFTLGNVYKNDLVSVRPRTSFIAPRPASASLFFPVEVSRSFIPSSVNRSDDLESTERQAFRDRSAGVV